MEGDEGRELYGGRVLSAGESFMAVRMVSWPCGTCHVEKNMKNTRDVSFALRAHAAVVTSLA